MRRPEESLHRAVVDHLRQRLPAGWVFWHTPNGGGRSKAEGGVLKALGVKAGIPDLFVAGEGRVVALELKAARGALSPAQRDAIAALGCAGIPTLVARDLDGALAALESLGVPLQGRAL